MTEPIDIVTAFCAAWSKLDLDHIMAAFAPDAVYHNIPIEPLEGTEAIRGMIESFTAGWDRVDFEILHIAAKGSVVMTERVDHFVSAERTISLPVMGIFELDGEHITAWRDYFDLNQFMGQMAG